MRPSPASILYQPLDEILGTRALVRVVRVLAAHGGSLAVADIAQRAKLTLPSVRAALTRLLDLGVATGVGAGRSVVCELRRDHPLVPELIALFAAEHERPAALLRALRKAAGRLRPEPWGVWLYGSVARAEDQATSDIDIALVTAAPDPSEQGDALRGAIVRTRATDAERISVIVMAPADVRRAAREKTPFWESLKRDAIVLFGDAPTGVLERAKHVRAG